MKNFFYTLLFTTSFQHSTKACVEPIICWLLLWLSQCLEEFYSEWRISNPPHPTPNTDFRRWYFASTAACFVGLHIDENIPIFIPSNDAVQKSLPLAQCWVQTFFSRYWHWHRQEQCRNNVWSFGEGFYFQTINK